MLHHVSKTLKHALPLQKSFILFPSQNTSSAFIYSSNPVRYFSENHHNVSYRQFSTKQEVATDAQEVFKDTLHNKPHITSKFPNIIPPKTMPGRLTGLFFEVLEGIPSFGPKNSKLLRELIETSKKSLTSDSNYENLKKKLESFTAEEMDTVIRMLYIHQHVLQIEEETEAQFIKDKRETPARKTVVKLIEQFGRQKVLQFLPTWMAEVFTAHPVFADKEYILTRKEHLSKTYKDWIRTNDIISHLEGNTPSYRDLRIEMDNMHDRMIESISTMLQTDPVREVKISSAQEQENLRRRLSKLVHDCLLMGDFVKYIIQESMIEDISEEFVNAGEADRQLEDILKKPRSYDRFQSLKNHELVKNHPEFNKIFDKDFYFTLNVWAFDLDGNPNVTSDTLMKSIAAGIKTLLLSEPFIERTEEVLPITIHKEDEDLADAIQNRLDEVEPYLSATLERTKLFSPLRRLCLAARRRLTYTSQKCDEVLTSVTPGFYELLNHRGFRTTEEFLHFIEPLVQAEKRYNVDKIWTKRARIAKNFTLPIGECHFRVAEPTNQAAIADYLHVLDPVKFPERNSLLQLPEKEQIQIFKEIINSKERVKNKELNKLSAQNLETLRNWKVFSVLQKESLIVQSDSTSPVYSIRLLKALGTLFDFRGQYAPLFESKETMEVALERIGKDSGHLFEQVRIMSAGSDNQKKMGLFLSSHYNIKFMAVADLKGLPSFLGKGDSVFRSKLLEGLTDMETCQPGRQQKFLENPKEYLLNRFIKRMQFRQQQAGMTTKDYKLMEKIAGTICLQAYEGRKKHLEKISPTLNKTVTEYLSKSLSTAYSRPDKKTVAGGDLLTSVRAIVASKIKLYTSMHLDTDVGDIKQNVINAIKELKAQGISEHQIHEVFKNPPYRAVTDALIEFLELYDPKIAQEQDTQNLRINVDDIGEVYQMLTGEPPKIGPQDPHLRLIRLICLEAKRNPETPYIPEYLFCRYPV